MCPAHFYKHTIRVIFRSKRRICPLPPLLLVVQVALILRQPFSSPIDALHCSVVVISPGCPFVYTSLLSNQAVTRSGPFCLNTMSLLRIMKKYDLEFLTCCIAQVFAWPFALPRKLEVRGKVFAVLLHCSASISFIL